MVMADSVEKPTRKPDCWRGSRKEGDKLPSSKALKELREDRKIGDGSIGGRVRGWEPSQLLENRRDKRLLEAKGKNAKIKGEVEEMRKNGSKRSETR